jgi:RNA polymerase sigma-70 factor (ECF subfamily)
VDDATLIARARRGDEGAFSALFTRYQRSIYHYAARMCGRDAGDDVVQETFLAVLRAPGGFDPAKGTLAGYLFGIARHHVMKRLTRQGVELLEPPDAESIVATAIDETPFAAVARNELVDAVRQAVEALPVVYREVVVLCDLQELDYVTAAGIIQCPVGTVRSRLHRARALLTARLAGSRPLVAAKRE